MFLNVSNHPSTNWSQTQYEAASEYGIVMDMDFPEIDPTWTKMDVYRCASEYKKKLMAMNPTCVMVQGEFTFTFALVEMLLDEGIKVVSSCTKRVAEEKMNLDGTTTKTSVFEFVRFREY